MMEVHNHSQRFTVTQVYRSEATINTWTVVNSNGGRLV